MATQQDQRASDVYEVRWHPIASRGRTLSFFEKVFPFGRVTPDDRYAVVYEKATGKPAASPDAARGGFMIENMLSDLETRTASEFRARYVDI